MMKETVATVVSRFQTFSVHRRNIAGLLFLDSNDLTGDLASVCDSRDPFVVADCAGTTTNKAPVSCFCCDQCCSKDEACNDDNLVPSQDGVWKFGYQRLQYTFGDELAFEVSNIP
jgi:hypothetical protein